MKERPVYAGCFQARRMQNRDHIIIGCALEVLIAREESIKGIAIKIFREERRRFDLRVYSLRKVFSKRQTEDNGAQILERDHTPNPTAKRRLTTPLHVPPALLGCCRSSFRD